MKKTVLITFFIVLMHLGLYAQDTSEESNFTVNTSLVNRFLWRGIYLDSRPNLQPSLVYSNKGFSGGAWGSYNITGGYAQTNFYAQYKVGGLAIQLMDHFVGNDTSSVGVDYFDYRNSSTNHILEASLVFSYEGFSILGSTFFYGGDKNSDNENRYSSYAELNYSLAIKKSTVLFFMGTALNEGIYADGFAVVHTGLKLSQKVKITDSYSLPIGFTIAANPDNKKMHFIVECALQ